MYKKSVVAFIDLLGFSNDIDSKPFGEIDSIIKLFQKHIVEFDNFHRGILELGFDILYNKDAPKLSENFASMNFFSDCVIWSYPIDKIPKDFSDTLGAIVYAFTQLQLRLYEMNIVIRGGITLGDIYISDNRIFGPALVKAARLEKLACYPVIAIDKNVIDNGDITSNSFFHNGLSNDISSDFYYIDIFEKLNEDVKSVKSSSSLDLIAKLKGQSAKRSIENIMKVLTKGVKHEDVDVRKKYEWMLMKTKKMLTM
jgi:hypothetical protein